VIVTVNVSRLRIVETAWTSSVRNAAQNTTNVIRPALVRTALLTASRVLSGTKTRVRVTVSLTTSIMSMRATVRSVSMDAKLAAKQANAMSVRMDTIRPMRFVKSAIPDVRYAKMGQTRSVRNVAKTTTSNRIRLPVKGTVQHSRPRTIRPMNVMRSVREALVSRSLERQLS
jgi:hypothetical protein